MTPLSSKLISALLFIATSLFNFRFIVSDDDFSVRFPYKPEFLIDLSDSPTFSSLMNSTYTYIVLDPDTTGLTPEEISALRRKGKILLAYLSVGEAEVNRDYWTPDWTPGATPKFLEQVNPDMRDRYKVFFWMPDWQATLLKYFRTHILQKGFSGVYLDALDSYRYFTDKGLRNTAGEDMITLVTRVRQLAASIQPDFLIFANNVPEMYGDTKFARTVDGLVAQSIWYFGDSLQDEQTRGRTNFTLQFLRRARNEAKMILAADFPTSQERICDFYVKCSVEVFRCAVFDDMFGGGERIC